MSTDETQNRAEAERQVTDDDRRRAENVGRDEETRAGGRDLDRDGIPDNQEGRTDGGRDLDRDGVPDNEEGRGARGRDLDRDGVPDNQERGRSGAGTAAAAAAAGGVAGAEVGRHRDRDHDGIPDNEEGRGTRGRDLDRDGVPDNEERRGVAANGSTRTMPAAGAAGAGYAAGDAYSRDGRRLVAPGFARGRLHVGINWGAAFFGWVVALGLAVILTALVAAIGAAVSVSRGATTADQAASQLGTTTQTVGVVGLVLLAVIAFVSYYGGGYVAARMSRFQGPRQGFAVWLWAIIVAIVVAILAAVAGSKYDLLSTLNTFPRVPVNQGDLTTTGIVALVLLLLITLLGAIVGGAAGMRYHRKLELAEADLADGRVEE